MSGVHHHPPDGGPLVRVVRAVVSGATSLDAISEATSIPRRTCYQHIRRLDRLGWLDIAGRGASAVIEATPIGILAAQTARR